MKKKTDDPTIDLLQRTIVRAIAAHSAGHGLILIGGFRYRYLDQSARVSRDIDYHWAGDLEQKQKELVVLFRRRILPALKRQFGYSGSVGPATGPDAESPAVKVVDVALWNNTDHRGRIEIPIEITRVVCVDPIEVRTLDGVVYPTLSNTDLIESKIIAVFGRHYLQHRDLMDIFLFSSSLRPESSRRIAAKLKSVEIGQARINAILDDFTAHRAHHIRSIQAVMDAQIEADTHKTLTRAGGAEMIFDSVITTLTANITKQRKRK